MELLLLSGAEKRSLVFLHYPFTNLAMLVSDESVYYPNC